MEFKLLIAVAVLAGIALLVAITALVKLRRLRRQQSAVLGELGQQDLVAHAAQLQEQFATLNGYVGDLASGLEHRMKLVEGRLDLALTKRALVRYDAFGELSGRQSASIAVLDESATGLVISSIVNRDSARIYVKTVQQQVGQPALSPEEARAVEAAMSGETVLVEVP